MKFYCGKEASSFTHFKLLLLVFVQLAQGIALVVLVYRLTTEQHFSLIVYLPGDRKTQHRSVCELQLISEFNGELWQRRYPWSNWILFLFYR